jgi:hypothetical protein
MRNLLLFAIAGLFLLSACDGTKKPSTANFTTAINQYLAKHGQACALMGRQFSVDVPRSVPGGPLLRLPSHCVAKRLLAPPHSNTSTP